VFWIPSALPDQNGPAASATEVKERPLSATLTDERRRLRGRGFSIVESEAAPTPLRAL
jgi:hypothetical protein